MTTVLITGATGFLGSHLCERLQKRGETVRALVRETSDTSFIESLAVELVRGDITEPASLPAAMEGVDIVYHAAAHVSDWAPWHDFESVTVHGTRNVFEAAVHAGAKRIVHVSTDGVYALRELKGVITEASALERRFGWFDYYRKSKTIAERTAREYAKRGDIEVAILRPGLLLGERDRAIFPGAVAFLKSGTAAYIGPGDNRIPYVYVGDVAEACILAGTEAGSAGEIYNAASDEVVTQRDLFEAIADATELNPPTRTMPLSAAHALAVAMESTSAALGRRFRPVMTRYGVNLVALDYQEDCSKLQSELGWTAEVPLRDAIQRTADWRKSHRPVAARS